MTLQAQTIISTVVAAVTGLTPATDSTAPSAFKDAPWGPLEGSGLDRGFTVKPLDGPTTRDTTGTSGVAHRAIRFAVVFQERNEGRTRSVAYGLAAENVTRVQDNVIRSVFAVGGIDTCVDEPAGYEFQDDAGFIVVTCPFRVEWYDDISTS